MSRREQSLRLQTRPRVDWFSILHDLRRLGGMTPERIAVRLEAGRTTVIGWKQGAEPKHADGERLIGLWCEVTGFDRQRLPITSCPRWLQVSK